MKKYTKQVLGNKTEAICDIEYQKKDSKVGIPSNQSVEDAKEWVDDGSKL